MVTPRYPPNIHGGGEISCKLMVDNLRKTEEVDVFTFDTIYPKSKSKILLNIRAYNYLKYKLDDYDIVHTYNMELLPCIGKLTKDININSLATLNGIVFSPSLSIYRYKYLSPKFYRNKLLSTYIKKIKYFITPFQIFKEKWIEDGLDSEKIGVISTLLDDSFVPLENDKNTDKVDLLYVGNYSPTRGEEIRKVVEGYSFLEKGQDITLTIVGKGKDKFTDLVKKYKPSNPIKILGKIKYSKIPEIYKNKDIFIHPSILPKTFDRVIYEAVLSGMCFITTGNDHYSTIFKNGQDGILLYPMTSKKLSEKIQMLIDDKPLRKKLAKNAKISLVRECSPNLVIKKYLREYNKLLR
jgi:glycosyltransferase involved in cell wall biosynthesis